MTILRFTFLTFLLSIVTLVTAQPNFRMAGFATENGGTSGGFGGDTVIVTNYTQFKSYAQSSAPYIIKIQGTISQIPFGDQVNINSNKTIVGVGDSAFLQGIGLAIGSKNNIILRNFKITLVGLTTPKNINDGDCISIYGSSKNIWIDHCELYSEDPDIQTNIDKYDGLIDIKQQTGFITISWCYLHDHHKGGLVGASDSDIYGDRKITFHHNYYNKVRLRVPMYRGAVGHFFNNYIVGAKDATEIRANTCVRVEKNYYESLHYSIYTPSDAPGKTQRIDNIEVNHASRPYPANCVADIPYDYSDVLTETTSTIKRLVPQWAGLGKLTEDCNGDLGGSAFIDNCEACVGGNTGQEACTNTGLNDLKNTLKDGVKLYPNPALTILNVEVNAASQKHLMAQIYDQTGRLLKSKTLHKNLNVLDVQNLEQGIYWVKISSTKSTFTKRFAKQN